MAKTPRRNRFLKTEIPEEEPAPRRQRRPRSENAPDYILKVWDGDRNIRVGAAWDKASGGISIKLNAFTVLEWRDFTPDGNFMLTLWPNDGDEVFGSFHD